MNTNSNMLKSINNLLKNLPEDWVNLTTHRLDIYNESKAKSEFLHELKALIQADNINAKTLEQLPTAYDYIRLGHQLSSLLEWVLSEINNVSENQVITFASATMPVLALLRTNAVNKQTTYIYYDGDDKPLLDESRLKSVYGYQYQLLPVNDPKDIPAHADDMVVFVTQQPFTHDLSGISQIDATVNIKQGFGSYVVIHNLHSTATVNAVQHVRRRETIAMSPTHCLRALHELAGLDSEQIVINQQAQQTVETCIKQNTGSQSTPLIASSGLSIQYALLMGLVENAKTAHPNKPIKIILPPNCYGGTNDQSRRIAELIADVEIVDLLVDGGADLVKSLEVALNSVAAVDGVPIVLTEIPTNPRVEVPDMQALGLTLSKQRSTPSNEIAVAPVFTVDQTFCPNVKLLGDDSELKAGAVISFSSGSKFPSGGRCIAGYCAANQAAESLMPLISAHLTLSDNQADNNQLNILAETMPSMPKRIEKAYENTRQLVDEIQTLLPNSKIFYVNESMAQSGFKPSVFSLDLPVDATTPYARQQLQKELNKKLIEFMIQRHPDDCKNCVSYGQLKGSYWTIPATSTQGTTKEADKDYVVRVSISPDVDVAMLAASFKIFCKENHLL